MSNRVRVGGVFEVWRSGESLGSPPSTLVAALLLGLAHDAPHWSDRRELARRLNASDGAFRLALHRLREWLGAGCIEGEARRVRLAGAWELDYSLASGEPATGAMIAPGIHNPLVDDLRRQVSPSPGGTEVAAVHAFRESVASAAQLDPDMARGLLVAGSRITEVMPTVNLAQLLSATRPRNREAPYFAEYCCLNGLLLSRQGAIPQATTVFEKGFRQATRNRARSLAANLSYLIAYALVEAGDFARASYWVGCLDALRRPSELILEAANTKAVLAWNANDHGTAASLMEGVLPDLARASHLERLRFYGNYAVLQSELGEQNLAQELLARGMEEASPELDRVFWSIRDLLAGTQMTDTGRGEEAADHFGRLEAKLADVDRIGAVYALEWQVKAYVGAGNRAQGLQGYRLLSQKRRDLGLRTNPRTRAKLEHAFGA